ncbi:hypothetical protein IC607_04060 [Cellulomonas sp. JH27-2]|uniref:hypothetical protein n=1 Tax=Cellulomonas sp. JH27-2 TaxID=2774139 RepID=UPI0017802E5C|nr:hypothetical protein [Cellulomonas sp. JH27-2]MBD8058141.1 hypothetical protein [Cellulomonas sp. JH27-2]
MDFPAAGADRTSAQVHNLPPGWLRADRGAVVRTTTALSVDRVPRHGDGRAHPVLAAYVWPAQWFAVVLERRGWYLHVPTGTAFGLRRSKTRPGGWSLAAFVAVWLLFRVLRSFTDLFWIALLPFAAVGLYTIPVGILLWWAHRQQRSAAERRGRIRFPADVPGEASALVVAGWHPSLPAGVNTTAEQAVRELVPVVTAGRPLYARAVSKQEDDRLRATGFDEVPGHFGLFVRRGTDA